MDKRFVRRSLFVALMGVLGTSGPALAVVEEVEPNDFANAQELEVTAEMVVNGVLGNLSGTAALDGDFYSFEGKEGDRVTLDIDGGYNSGQRSVDTLLTLFGTAGEWLLEVDDVNDLDEGSVSPWDARIDGYRLPADGKYTVAVSPSGVLFNSGGTYRKTGSWDMTNGDYRLVVTGLTPPVQVPEVQAINLDIKPGNREFAVLNPKSKGVIPVALLSSDKFDAVKVDVKSVTFGATGDERSLKRCGKYGVDINGDGRADLMCHFQNDLAKFSPADLTAVVKGKTVDGMGFEGRGALKVIPAEKARNGQRNGKRR